MKKIILVLAVFFLSAFYGAELSFALEGGVNISADVPLETPDSGGGAGYIPISDSESPKIFDVQTAGITSRSAVISWKTNESSFAWLYYGKTLSYEIGALQIHPEIIVSSHEIRLENLEENSRYYFRLVSHDSAGNQSIKDGYEFRTLPENKIFANVGDFKAEAGDSRADLSWRNPPDADFQAVKILRSEKFYPRNPEDGELVYDAKGNSFADTQVKNGIIYYYTAFAYGSSGNFASGSVAMVMPQKYSAPSIAPSASPQISFSPAPSFFPRPSPPPSITPIASPISPEIIKIKLEDFDFIQDGKKISPEGGIFGIEPEKPLMISVDFQKIPSEIATMMLILEKKDGSGDTSSFLFRAGAEKNNYSVAITSPESNNYRLTIALLNAENDVVKALNGELDVGPTEKMPEKIVWYFYLLLILLIALIIILVRYIFKKAKRVSFEAIKRKEKDK